MKNSITTALPLAGVLLSTLSAALALSDGPGLPVVPKYEPGNLSSVSEIRPRDVSQHESHVRRQAGTEDLLPPDFPPRCATECGPYTLSMGGCGSASATSQQARLGCECNNAFFETWVNCALCYPETYDSSPGKIGGVVTTAQNRCTDAGLPVVVDMSRIPGAAVPVPPASDPLSSVTSTSSTSRTRPRPTPKIVEETEEDEEEFDTTLARDDISMVSDSDDLPSSTAARKGVMKGTMESSPTSSFRGGNSTTSDEDAGAAAKLEASGMMSITFIGLLAVATIFFAL